MASSNSKMLQFFLLMGKLKATRRTGWVRKHVQQPESIADHMYRMGAMAFLAGPELNKDRCIKLALVHDMAECIVGDIAPSDGVSKDEKHRQEKEAMEHICTLVPSHTAEELTHLWMEYENQSSDEARFVKDLDRFDMILQAYEYEQADDRPGNLQEFFDSTQGRFSTPIVQGWVQELNNTRAGTLRAVEGASNSDENGIKRQQGDGQDEQGGSKKEKKTVENAGASEEKTVLEKNESGPL